MLTKDVLIEINEDVKDLIRLGFEVTTVQGDYVPHSDDPGLTFESGRTKKAKLIETCVLYADVRNSTILSKTRSKEDMARMYSAFTSSAIYAAQHHGGIVRNIIGDRVMIVFPKNNCFTNAVDTAISINTIASRIINEHFKGFDFKVGIGIDYGEMKVIKAGVSKQGKERATHKNLVWIGNPANIASKLTDVANKDWKKTIYRVTRFPINPKALRPKIGINSGLIGPIGNLEVIPGMSLYKDFPETVDITPEDFANSIRKEVSGNFYTVGGKLLTFEKIEKTGKNAPILMTQFVWEQFKKANPERSSVINNNWTEQDTQIREYTGQIKGGDVIWTSIDQIDI